jgi:hypothetical protein
VIPGSALYREAAHFEEPSCVHDIGQRIPQGEVKGAGAVLGLIRPHIHLLLAAH